MSDKDSVSSQDIPAVLRALGTLALAAATAVAIKWFLSHDQIEKGKDNYSKLQCNQDSIEDAQPPGDDPKSDEETVENNIREPQVSDEKDLMVLEFDCFSRELLKSSLEMSCPNMYVEEKSGFLTDHKSLSSDRTPVSREVSMVSAPQSDLHISEQASVSISGLPAAFVYGKTKDTQNQVLSSCFAQTYDMTFNERSQEQQIDTGTRSSNGECIDVMTVKFPECKSQFIGDDNMVSRTYLRHKAVNVGLDEDLFNKDKWEINGNLNSDTDLNISNHTKPCAENDDNMPGIITGRNMEENTKEHICKRDNHVKICFPCLPESQETDNTFIKAYSPFNNEILARCHNSKQQTIYTTFTMLDILQTEDAIQEANQTTITISNEDTVLTNKFCKHHFQNKKINCMQNNHPMCSRQSSKEQNIYVNSEETLEELNDNLTCSNMISVPVPEEYKTVREKNGKLFSSLNTLHTYHNGKHDKEFPSRGQISSDSHDHVEWCLPESGAMDQRKIKNTISHSTNHVMQWNTTCVFNSTEYINLMYPLDNREPENVIIPVIENDEGQTNIQHTVSLLSDKSVPLCYDGEHHNLDAEVESFFESSTSHNILYDKLVPTTMRRKNLCDPSTLNTFNSTTVTNTDIQSIKSTSNKQDNDEIYNGYKQNSTLLTMDQKEFCTAITNGYFSRYQKQVDSKSFGLSSEELKSQECYSKNQQTAISKPLSNSLPNNVILAEESPCQSPIYSNPTALSDMMDISKSELKCQQITKENEKDPHLFVENVAVSRVEETSDSLWSSVQSLEQSILGNPDFSSNESYSAQGSITSSPLHNEEQDKSLEIRDQERLDTIKSDTQSFSRERIMSTIAETPELILPEYQSVFISERKMPLMTKSCDNIFSGPSFQGSAMKSKAQSMICLLTEYYTTKLHSLENGPLEKVSRGCFIHIPKGFQNIREGVSFQLTLGNCLELLKLARKNSVPELLKALYTLISDNYLNVLKNSAIYSQLTGLEREKILQLRTRGKLSLCIIETQSIFGLNKNISRLEIMTSDQPINQIYSLDMESNEWKRVTNIPEEACLKGCSICSMHNYLFIAGGIQKTKNGSLCSDKLFCYNPLTDIWTQLTPMNQARSQLKLVPLDGYLYAIGGECLQTMERYDPRLNKWTLSAPLPKGSFAVAHEAAACGGDIYISGGHLFYRLLKYNPIQNQWEECPFNASKGRSCDMVALGHILYRFDMHKESRVHIFKYNTTAKVWSEYTATFPNSKVPFRCAVLDGAIYCLNRETTARFSVEGEKAMFESTMFNKVPTKGVGYHCPVVLSLQSPLSQTSV
ncbi:uncharacterized protein LOC143769826 [Ranitomeya variabilis]|uniref:uncharacterized protein LOC143769826 n=1 Tax=Ranitomeya variabilis TaxID=490064 RepID=UPI004056A530